MLDLHTRQHGYTEIYPPYLVKKECLYGAGQLPKFADNIYHDAEDDLWMIGTAEVPVTNLHRDEILEASALPLSYVAYTACFRREKMSAGRDVRGIKRGHQFDKVEMYKIVAPSDSDAELEQIVDSAEAVARGLGIPHRVISICTGDLGFVAAKKYDIELWAPGCNEWLEVSSCSNCTDFQARRANIRYRPAPRGKPEFVHTLNGSGSGAAAGHDRGPGELPAGRRQRSDSGGAAAVHGYGPAGSTRLIPDTAAVGMLAATLRKGPALCGGLLRDQPPGNRRAYPACDAELLSRLGVRRHSALRLRVCRQLVRRGRGDGWTTDVDDAERRLRERTAVVDGIIIRRFANLSNWLAYHRQLYLPRHLWKHARRHVGEFDLVHLHSHRHLLQPLVAGPARRAGVPYVFTGNGTVPVIERYVLVKRLADPLGARDPSSTVRRRALRWPRPSGHTTWRSASTPDRIAVIPNGIRLDEFVDLPRARRVPARSTNSVTHRWSCSSARSRRARESTSCCGRWRNCPATCVWWWPATS